MAETNAWWAVKLSESMKVTEVIFTNIDDACCDRKPQFVP